MAHAQIPQISARATSLRDQVSESIRAGLISGELAPGQIYSAPQLAAQMGVSATPVREAMLYFEREGMVTKMRNTGYKVTELSDDILDGAAEARILLEVPTMAKVARICTGDIAEKVAELRALAHELNDAAERGDLVSYLQADLRFHCDFLALAGNPVIVETVSSLRTRSRVTGASARRSGQFGCQLPRTRSDDRCRTRARRQRDGSHRAHPHRTRAQGMG